MCERKPKQETPSNTLAHTTPHQGNLNNVQSDSSYDYASSSSSNDSSRSLRKLLCHLSRQFTSFSSSERSSSSLSDVVNCYLQKSSCDVGSSSSSLLSMSNHLAAWHKNLSQDEKKQYVSLCRLR